MNPTPYVNDHSRLLEKFAQQGDALAAKAAEWLDKLATAKAEAAAAEEAFAADLKPGSASELVEAQNKVRALIGVTNAIENAGGPEEIRARALRAPAVFSVAAQGFAERVAALEKLVPLGLKRLGECRASLTEAGVDAPRIETDATVCAWRTFGESIVSHVAAAKAGEGYAALRGVNCTPKKFDELYEALTAPLPQPPRLPEASR
jgi:hypothetical protein